MSIRRNYINIFKYIIYGIVLLLLFHFESLSIGPVKISHLWKGALLFYLIIAVFRNNNNKFLIYKSLILLAVFQLLNIEILNNPFNAVLLFGTTLIMPLLGIYCLKFKEEELKRGLLFFASFFILSFVPYKLGILQSLNEGYRLSGYGVKEQGVIGPFQTVHSASVALAGSFLVVLYFWLTKTFNRIYLTILLILGFYFLIFTYVRTGMAMVVVGVIPILLYFTKQNIKAKLRLLFFMGVLSVLISGWVLSNETLLNRITGQRVAAKTSEFDSFETLGSGRGRMLIYSVEIFMEANVIEKIIGVGQTEQKLRMGEKLGHALIPHNGFLLLLLSNGVIGLSIFLLFLRKLWKLISKLYGAQHNLLKGLFFAYIVMTFFQNYDIIYIYLMLVMTVAYTIQLNIKYRQGLVKRH